MKKLSLILIITVFSQLNLLSQNNYEEFIKNKPCIYINFFSDRNKVLLPTDGDSWEYRKFDKLVSILDNDLFSFYNLNNKYSTPLKKQTFQKTEEYTQVLLPEFKEICRKVKEAEFYTLFNLKDNEAYNLTKHNFNFEISVSDYDYMINNIAGYIGLGANFFVSFPQSRTTIKKINYANGRYYIHQYISTPTIPENIASHIEDEMSKRDCSVSLMFVVKPFKIVKENRNINGLGFNYSENNILAKTIGVYIVDTDTKEILCDISSVLSTTPTKKN